MGSYGVGNSNDTPHALDAQETVMSTKGDWYRASSTTREEQDLRDRYARGKLSFDQYEIEYRKLMKRGLIKRNGRTLK